ncbi:hypothetical protein AKI39_21085 [Bordetella sp. H567]|uniref:periplasmic heavy metal sensor n=1 Tax=Bordetella sp. H567 TaxID=1697043 RepID=UPI00081C8514|nr:periplasmic heavy metal sensor [Bordetella sp. H567]AOB32701.1 hypothetical protein AKI39_21085 [Bordetella sp. H567]
MNGRGWKFFLIGSLILNAFLLGGIAGGAYQWFSTQRAQESPRAPHVALRFAAEGLAPERQQQFLAAIREARRDGREYARAAREARRAVLDLLAAPQLDRAALDAALARTREADMALRTRVERAVADFAATLSPEERMTFAAALRQRGQWREPAAPPQRQGRP